MKIKFFIVLLLGFCLLLTSCGGFFAEEEPLQIYSIENEILSDGQTKITITYTNEDKAPDIFYIPQGQKGEDGVIGNGIQSITYEKSEDGTSTTLVIKYTNPESEDTVFNIPNGISVVGTESNVDPLSGNTFMYLLYSNGEKSEPIKLLRGLDGNGIIDYQIVTNEDLSQTLTFVFSDSDDVIITIPAPNQGNGISSIIGSEEDGFYILTINYDLKEEPDIIKFAKPAEPSKWYSGPMRPNPSLGVDGDYYFNTQHEEIYLKEGSNWTLIVQINSYEQVCNVKFDLNDSATEPAYYTGNVLTNYTVKRGSIFSDNGYGEIPLPYRPGYVFKGWYRSKVISQINTPFTDLVSINSDLYLYAIWEKE